jgi:hypothetical protein
MTRLEVERIEKPYKSLLVAPLRDKRLSYKARGVLYYLLSKPDNWKGQIFDLVSMSEMDGISSVKSAIRELVKYGYAELITTHDPQTKKITGKYYRVHEYSKNPPKINNTLL